MKSNIVKMLKPIQKNLVTNWLTMYKFNKWNVHSDGRVVTQQEKYFKASMEK